MQKIRVKFRRFHLEFRTFLVRFKSLEFPQPDKQLQLFADICLINGAESVKRFIQSLLQEDLGVTKLDTRRSWRYKACYKKILALQSLLQEDLGVTKLATRRSWRYNHLWQKK